MPNAFCIAEVEVTDPETFKSYGVSDQSPRPTCSIMASARWRISSQPNTRESAVSLATSPS